MTTAPAPAAAKAKTAGGYVVLRKGLPGLDVSGGEHWERIGTSTEKNATAAIRAVLTELGEHEIGTFVAVPARSWRPVKVTPKAETRLIVEEVKP